MKPKTVKLKNNTIYQYKGGGYVGCLWEWNFCLIDNQGKLRDILSSGYKGIPDGNKDKLRDYVKDLANSYRPETSLYTYNIKKERDMTDLYDNCQGDNVNDVYKFLFDNISEYYKQPCYICKNKYDPNTLISGIDLGYLEGYGGLAAGSGINYVCENCCASEHLGEEN
jgi:hypothetical protein